MKKPRSDSKLDGLPPKQQAELSRWLTEENVSYEEARQRVHTRFGVLVSSDSTFSDFYHSSALPWKYAQAQNFASEMARLKQGEFKPAIMRRLEQLAYELAASQNVNPKTLKAFLKMITDSEKVALQKGNLELAVQRFREAVKSSMEKGLDALFAEVKDNPEALALYQKFKAAAMKGVEGAK
ncbi:MAG: hypothetical protein Q8J78_04880 [Moraxellaceae bacterium]|nr:hypothetical protein [Moraxellaceae bacterium]